MALRQILIEPNKILREKSLYVENVDKDIQILMDDMLDTMYTAPGIGLAAIQVGIPKRVIVLDIKQKEGQKNPIFLVNPEIVDKSKNNSTYEEGCLSVPGFYEVLHRAERISVHALTTRGEKQVFEAEGLLAVCIQHECDHLDGKLFVDYLSGLKRNRIRKKLLKQQKHSA